MISINEFIDRQSTAQGPEGDPDPLVTVRGYGRVRKSQCRMMALQKMTRLTEQLNSGLPFNHSDYDLLKSFMDALL